MPRPPAVSIAILIAAVTAACGGRPLSSDTESTQRPLVTPLATAGSPSEPNPSPASTPVASEGLSGQLAYAGGQDPQVFLLDLDTGESRQLTRLTPEHGEPMSRGPIAPVMSCGFGVQNLRWSPDGTMLAFDYGSCEAVVYVVDLDGRMTRIGDGRGATWSPDGRSLLYSANAPYCMAPDCGEPPHPGAWNLQIVDVTDAGFSGSRPLMTDEVTELANQPTYSLDGMSIAFAAPMPDPGDDQLFGATFVSRADGSDIRLVARGAWPPGWLPDGRLLLVDEQTGSLGALDLDTGDAVALGTSVGPSVVSPDATRLLLVTTDPTSGLNGVELATIDGETLATYGGHPAAWAPDSRAAVLMADDGSALLVIDRDGGELGQFPLPPTVNWPAAAWRPGT